MSTLLGLGGITLICYTRVLRNLEGIIFNPVKKTDAPLSIKVAQRCGIEVIYSAKPTEVSKVAAGWFEI